MAKKDGSPRFTNVSDNVVALMDSIARFLLTAGGLAALVGIGLMVTAFFNLNGAGAEQAGQAAQYLDMFRQAAMLGTLAAAIGAGWMLWGEETAGPIMLIVGLALVFSPTFLAIGGQGPAAAAQEKILDGLRVAGIPAVVVGFFLIIGDVATRIKTRSREGARAEQMKYGKDVKEERDTRNVFLGKCWQLPYCRKFVRERCPIYHAKTTCWKERVGCMCEESVIKNAMSAETISGDVVAAAKYIPKNNKLTASQKAERCKQCVIFNEHQKHKYKLALPVTALGIAGLYIALREPVGRIILNTLMKADSVTQAVGLSKTGDAIGASKGAQNATSLAAGTIPYHEIILFVIALVTLAYAIKVLEYMFFQAKV